MREELPMENPLIQIENWLLSIDQNSQNDLISLAAHFHLDENVYTHSGDDLGLKYFYDYLNTTSLSNREIVIRTLFTITLIDFALSGRDTEESWSEFFDRMLYMRSKGSERDMDISWIDKKLNSFQDDKEKWLTIASSWSDLKFNSLNDKHIMNWYALAGHA